MPHYDSLLLSSWTPRFLPSSLLYPPPPKIPSQIEQTMKFNENIAYASMPKELQGRRNVVSTGPKRDTGRFKSGKARSESVSSARIERISKETHRYNVNRLNLKHPFLRTRKTSLGLTGTWTFSTQDLVLKILISRTLDCFMLWCTSANDFSVASTTRQNIVAWNHISLTHMQIA